MPKDIWITAGTAAKLLEERFGRPIRVDYVTRLGSLGRIRKQDMGSRIVLYHRHDVEQVQIRERKKPSADKPTQTELPLAEKAENAIPEKQLISALSQPETLQILTVARFEDMPTGSMKRRDFVKQHGLNNSEMTQWLEYGLKGDRLPVTYYPFNEKQAAAFDPTQQDQVLEILRRHGKIK